MKSWQKAIKYAAMAFAIFLTVSIVGGILGAFDLFNFVFDDEAVLGEMKTYTVSGEITDLRISIPAADFKIETGEAFSVESNLSRLTVKEEDGCLIIEEPAKPSIHRTDAVLTLYIPVGVAFGKADITTGAGRVTVDRLSAAELSMALGAGEVVIDELYGNAETDIDGGAGALTIKDCQLNKLDLDMGVGKLELTGILTHDCDIDMGVGEADITLVGSKAEYCVSVDKGLGAVTIDGQSVDDGGTYGSGEDNRLEISGGVGKITVDFTAQTP